MPPGDEKIVAEQGQVGVEGTPLLSHRPRPDNTRMAKVVRSFVLPPLGHRRPSPIGPPPRSTERADYVHRRIASGRSRR